jgi:nitronate monooxygenase
VLDLRDLDRPVVAAPMAGGASTPALATAVTEAGGLGYVAAGYKNAAAVADDLAAVRAATSGPLALNVFMVERHEPLTDVLDAYRAALEPEAERFGVALGEPTWDDDDRQAKVELVLDERPDLVSFTFGCPDVELLRQLANAGVHTAVTVTTADEAREAVARGAHSLIVQGPDAGAHRGTWDLLAEPSAQPLPGLLRDIREAVEVPLVAGGGVMDAAGVDAVLRAGAVAALCGTAYLLADEAGTNPLHRKALTDPAFEATELTRAYTGRWARGLANRFIAEHRDAPAGYPQLHHLTSPLRKAAVAAGDAQVAHLWAGTGRALARPGPAADITRSLTP